MPVNDFYPYATDSGANVISQATWAAGTLSQGQTRGEGFLGGKDALSQEANKVWRQSQFMAAALAKYVVDNMDVDVLDNGDLDGFLANFTTALTKSSGRVKATAVFNVYVSVGGDDTDDGLSSSTAFATIQRAWDYLQHSVDLNGHGGIINVGPGTYEGVQCFGMCIGQTSAVQIIGDRTTPSNVVVAAFNDQCFYVAEGAWVYIQGFAVTATGVPGTGTGNAIISTIGSTVFVDRINFGACSTSHCFASRGAYLGILAGADCTIAGGALAFAISEISSIVEISNASITLSGTPYFGDAFAVVDQVSTMRVVNGTTFIGSATGYKFNIQMNGVIYVNAAGGAYLPGSLPGLIGTGGQYV